MAFSVKTVIDAVINSVSVSILSPSSRPMKTKLLNYLNFNLSYLLEVGIIGFRAAGKQFELLLPAAQAVDFLPQLSHGF